MNTQSHRTRNYGFTIVELLIVIVVIAILAAITIIAYNGIQSRARISQRAGDVSAIQKSLELFKADNSVYPAVNATTAANLPSGFAGSYGCITCYAYSVSTDNTWMKGLIDAKTVANPILDPINNNSNFYMYYVNNGAGFNGCPGPFYVIVVESPNAGSITGSKGLNCSPSANFTVNANRAVFSNIPGQ